jgi:cbb3-type cytochrome oxidase cytochrome c subunit
MPATESTWRNQALLHRVFAVSGVVLTLTTVWMFYKDHSRSWKTIQPKALSVEQKMTEWREEQVKATATYQAHEEFEKQLLIAETRGIDVKLIEEFIALLEDDAKFRSTTVSAKSLLSDAEKLNDLHADVVEARKAADAATKAAEKSPNDDKLRQMATDALRISLKKDEAARAQRKKIIAELKKPWAYNAKVREDKLLNERKVRNGKIDAAKANVDIAIRDHKPTKDLQDEVNRLIDEPRSGYADLNKSYLHASDFRKKLDKTIKAITQEQEAAKKASEAAQADLVRLETAFKEKRETYFTSSFPFLGKKIVNWPIIDAFGTTRKIDNLWSKDLEIGYGSFKNVTRFDRCTTCHQAMQKSLPGEATSPAYVKEQRFELVIVLPKAEESAKKSTASETPSAEALLGIRFANAGLLNDSDITVKFVRPQSPAARALIHGSAPGEDEGKEVPGAAIRDSVAAFVSEPSAEEALFPKRPGLMVGDVIEGVNGDPILGSIRSPERVAAMLADLVAEGKPIRLQIRRGLPNPYTSHPRLDLYISDSSPHRMATFACTICHEGQGSATDFKWASHTPNSPTQAETWTHEQGWFDNPHWIMPMHAKRFTESTCLKCHHEVVELEPSEKFPTPPAPKVVHGYELIRKYGCFGCHEVNGFDGPAKRVGPDLRLEPNYFAVAQELTRGLASHEKKFDDLLKKELAKKLDGRTVADVQKDYQTAVGEKFQFESEKAALATSTAPDKDAKIAKATAGSTKADEQVKALAKILEPVRKSLSAINAQRDQLTRIRELCGQLSAHPEDNAARAELRGILEEDSQNKDAQFGQTLSPEDQKLAGMLKDVEVPGTLRKVGPSLRYIGQKLDNTFLYDWLNNPKNFRETTRMPKFFNLHDHLQDAEDEESLHIAQKLEPIEIRGVMAFLMNYKQDFEPIKPLEGMDVGTPEEQLARGKFQFETRGCLACHTHVDFPDISKYRKPEDIVQGPDLSNINLKFAAKRNPQGKSWLYSWIKDPTRYHARTVMPNLFLNRELHPKAPNQDPKNPEPDRYFDPAADIVEFLLSQPVPPEGTKSPVDLHWKPVPEASKKLADIQGATMDLDELVLEYLKEAFPATAEEFLQKGIDPKFEAELKGAEKELVVRGSADLLQQKLRYIGRKTISKYGCYGCHDIPKFEDAKPIGTGLADWGRKDPSKLAFEHIAEYMEHHGQAKPGAHGPHGGKDAHAHPPAAKEAAAGGHDHEAAVDATEAAETKEFFHHQLEAGNRIGFIYQKLQEPRSYDYKKTHNKRYNERLRMPQFPFSVEEREAVITFVLGLVAEPPREKYLYKPSPRSAALIAGKKVLEKYNCGGCHLLESEKWKISYAPDAYGQQTANPTYPFLLPHFNPTELAAQGKPDGRDELHSIISGMPTYSPDGRPRVIDESDDNEVQNGDPYDPEAVKYALDLYRPALIGGGVYITGQNPVTIPNRNIDERYPATGGVLARYLIPRVTQYEKQFNPNASGSEAFGWVPPPLVREGDKVQPNWLHDFLLEPYPIRPAAFLRMPKFNMTSAEATDLVNYFAAHDNARYPYELAETKQSSKLDRKEQEYRKLAPDADAAEPGRSVRFDHAMRIVTNNNYCVKCHAVADFVPQGNARALAPNLADVYRRLRPEYTRNWIANPKMILPYTSMPVNIPYDAAAPHHGGISQELFRGTAEEQVEGLVDLLTNFDQYAKSNTKVNSLVPPAPAAAAAETKPEEK